MKPFKEIQSSLIAAAARQTSCATEEIDKQIGELIEQLSFDIQAGYNQLEESDHRIFLQVLRKVFPEILGRAQPTDAVAMASPEQSTYILEAQESLLSRQANRRGRGIYFTPLAACQLFDVEVKYVAGHFGLKELLGQGEERSLEGQLAEGQLHPSLLWFGIKVNDAIKSLSGLNFYCDWPKLAADRKASLQDLLPFILWEANGQRVQMGKGFKALDVAEAGSRFDEELLYQRRIEKQCRERYDSAFLHMTCTEEVTNTLSKQAYPDCFTDLFLETTLAPLEEEKLLWLQLDMPGGMTMEEASALRLYPNAVPVINRRIDISRDFVSSELSNIIPLSEATRNRPALCDNGEYFLGIQRIFSIGQPHFCASPFTRFGKEPGTYALQQGHIAAFDSAVAYQRVERLQQQLKTETAAFNNFERNRLGLGLGKVLDGLQRQIKELDQLLQRIPEQDKTPRYFLHVCSARAGENIHVRFWTTQGDMANGLLDENSLLQQQDKQGLTANSLRLLTRPTNGRKPLDENEQIEKAREWMLKRGLLD